MSKLTDYEVTAFVAFVMSTISMDTRLRLMKELPEVYCKLVGRRVVASVHLCLCGRVPEGCTCEDRNLAECVT
jgi:hypothetical protein